MLSTALAVVGIEAPTPSDLRELLQQSELAQVQLNTLLDAQAAQIAQLTRDLDAVKQQPHHHEPRALSESQTCCRWTNSDACGSDVTAKCTQLHETLEHHASTHVFEDVDSCLGATQADWGFAFHGEDAEVALSTAGSEVARVKTPIKVTLASDCSATAELQMDTTVAGALSVSGTLTSSSGTDIGAAIIELQQQMAAIKAAGVVEALAIIDTGVSANYKYAGAAAVGTSVFFAPSNQNTVGVLDTTTSTFSTIDTTAAGVTADYKYSSARRSAPASSSPRTGRATWACWTRPPAPSRRSTPPPPA